ncbi:tetratricopeptide repeat-containing glycosyltransferase [Mycolicibacterium phocaicum]|uniref:tetratricopeptide repeat-containing glycosyltransferase n=1 Tax=Mycolicibacterium phocaicum TaxID=319706 RepID=UPI001CFADB4A|nr:glycosyltransferase [Mycolicibacterium phocaicum]UCZ59927.1 glycosyltransferase [Mycolicibacterium phocaicum]
MDNPPGPTICLNMIVRNEAHIVTEVLDAVAPYISYWVIVDTGSADGTQETIRNHMAHLGVPGEVHERRWRNFGENRSEALQLAHGHSDYIWVMDADDTVRGRPDFTHLSADVYSMRISDGLLYWRRQLFRDGLPWRYVGVVHEYADCTEPFHEERLEGDYFIESRRLGARNNDPKKYERDRDLLLAEVQRDPTNERSAFYLAESYFNLGDFANARIWAARRAEMGGWDEETFYALCQVARSMSRLGEPWPQVLDAYLRAWAFRPTRAEPLHAVAAEYRARGEYQIGYLFARCAAEIPLPEDDILFVDSSVYQWRTRDEQSICASWIGKHEESFTLCSRLLERTDIPDDDRRRIAKNRDQSVPALLEAAISYPESLVNNIIGHAPSAEISVSLVTGTRRDVVEASVDSFVNCCLDVARVGRFVALDTGLPVEDRRALQRRYPFLEFITGPRTEGVAQLQFIQDRLHGRYWLHLGQGWRFFAPETLIGRLQAVLDAEPHVVQVGINIADASSLTGACAAADAVRSTADGTRYVLVGAAVTGPAMFDVERLNQVLDAGPVTAQLDGVFSIQRG